MQVDNARHDVPGRQIDHLRPGGGLQRGVRSDPLDAAVHHHHSRACQRRAAGAVDQCEVVQDLGSAGANDVKTEKATSQRTRSCSDLPGRSHNRELLSHDSLLARISVPVSWQLSIVHPTVSVGAVIFALSLHFPSHANLAGSRRGPLCLLRVSCLLSSQHNSVPSRNRSVTVAAQKTKALPSRERERAVATFDANFRDTTLAREDTESALSNGFSRTSPFSLLPSACWFARRRLFDRVARAF